MYEKRNIEGLLHCDDGPAVVTRTGDKYWYQNGLLHRTDGPAAEYSRGVKFWFINDQFHRTDGPAVMWDNGEVEYWINGIKYTEDEYRLILFTQYGLNMHDNNT